MQLNENELYRKAFLEQNLERIEVSFLKSRDRGDAKPTVLVLDLLDPRGSSIAATMDDGERLASQLAEAARRGGFPLATSGLSAQLAEEILALEFPDEPIAIDTLDAHGVFLTVVVAQCGFSVLLVSETRLARPAVASGRKVVAGRLRPATTAARDHTSSPPPAGPRDLPRRPAHLGFVDLSLLRYRVRWDPGVHGGYEIHGRTPSPKRG